MYIYTVYKSVDDRDGGGEKQYKRLGDDLLLWLKKKKNTCKARRSTRRRDRPARRPTGDIRNVYTVIVRAARCTWRFRVYKMNFETIFEKRSSNGGVIPAGKINV